MTTKKSGKRTYHVGRRYTVLMTSNIEAVNLIEAAQKLETFKIDDFAEREHYETVDGDEMVFLA